MKLNTWLGLVTSKLDVHFDPVGPSIFNLAQTVRTYLKTTDGAVGKTNIAVAFDRRKVMSSNET